LWIGIKKDNWLVGRVNGFSLEWSWNVIRGFTQTINGESKTTGFLKYISLNLYRIGSHKLKNRCKKWNQK